MTSQTQRWHEESLRLRRFLADAEQVQWCDHGKVDPLESRGGPSDLLTQAGGSHRVIQVRR